MLWMKRAVRCTNPHGLFLSGVWAVSRHEASLPQRGVDVGTSRWKAAGGQQELADLPHGARGAQGTDRAVGANHDGDNKGTQPYHFLPIVLNYT